jgi:hypothetical protein
MAIGQVSLGNFVQGLVCNVEGHDVRCSNLRYKNVLVHLGCAIFGSLFVIEAHLLCSIVVVLRVLCSKVL